MNRLRRFRQLSLLSIFVFSATAAVADQHNFAYARVVSAQPVYQNIEQRRPQKHCWIETVREQRRSSNASAAVVGGVIGGAIGHAVGHGRRNKKLGTAVGAILGAAIGNDVGQNNRRHNNQYVQYRDVERCEIRENISTFEQLVGYDVTYQYSGQRYTTHMREHPGDRIKVAIDVRPVSY